MNIEKYSKKLESLYSDSPIHLMSNIYQVTSQCDLNASNGLCSEVVATCESFENILDRLTRETLYEHKYRF